MTPRSCLGSRVTLLLLALSFFSAAADAAFWIRQYDAGPYEQVGCPECIHGSLGHAVSPVRARHALAVHNGAAWITGRSYDGSSDNVLTVKYNELGTVLWARQWDGGSDEIGMAVKVDSQGNAYVVGATWQETEEYGPQPHLLLLKYDPNGNLLWSRTRRTYASTWGLDLLLVDDQPYVAAQVQSEEHLLAEVLRYSPNGDLNWTRILPSFEFENESKGPIGLATDGLGHIYVAGWFSNSDSPAIVDVFVAKYGVDGQQLWAAFHDSGEVDIPYGVSVDSSSRVFVTGQGGTTGWDGTGALLWNVPFTGTAYGVLADAGSVYVTGTDGRMRTVRYDVASGAELWTHLEDQNGVDDTGYTLGMAGGTLFIAGKLGSVYGDPTWDSLLLGLDSATGTVRYIGLNIDGDDRFYTIATSPARVWAAGQLTTAGGNSNTFLWSTDDVLPLPRLTDLKITPIVFAGGCQSPAGRITLDNTAPASGTVVTLTSTNPVAIVPAQVTVPAGQTQVTFPITAPFVSQAQDGVVTASAGGGTDSSSLKVRPIAVRSLTLGQNPVTGPALLDAAVFLECPAPTGGLVVRLASSNTTVARPNLEALLIPAGATTGRFTISVSDVTSPEFVDIRANTAGGGKTVRLQVN